jgi:hypothetical protein
MGQGGIEEARVGSMDVGAKTVLHSLVAVLNPVSVSCFAALQRQSIL